MVLTLLLNYKCEKFLYSGLKVGFIASYVQCENPLFRQEQNCVLSISRKVCVWEILRDRNRTKKSRIISCHWAELIFQQPSFWSQSATGDTPTVFQTSICLHHSLTLWANTMHPDWLSASACVFVCVHIKSRPRWLLNKQCPHLTSHWPLFVAHWLMLQSAIRNGHAIIHNREKQDKYLLCLWYCWNLSVIVLFQFWLHKVTQTYFTNIKLQQGWNRNWNPSPFLFKDWYLIHMQDINP